jgi:hypothetical protein
MESITMSLTIKTKVLNHDLAGNNYFQPRPTILPDNTLVMTLQTIGGSDYFGPVQITSSKDNGNSWEKPQYISTLGWKPVENELTEGVCDVVPDYNPTKGKLLAIGHSVYYKDDHLFDTCGDFKQEKGGLKIQRHSTYSVCNKNGKWSGRKRIYWEEFKDCSVTMCGCAQKIILPDGKIIIPLVIGYWGRRDRMVCSLLCDFDGEEIKVLNRGNILELPVNRGLLEPSIVLYEGKFFLTLRAEDGHGYISTSDDGLNWEPIRQWSWEDGSKLTMSTTQQHWLKLGGKLYLIYTRKNDENDKVFRWRAPLFIAEFDTEKLCLKKDTEQIVFPMHPHPENPESIGMMGNFHPLALSETEAIVTVGEMRPKMGFSGDTLLARITV